MKKARNTLIVAIITFLGLPEDINSVGSILLEKEKL